MLKKQKLSKRNTYTPTNAPQVRSNCDSVLNSSNRVRNSVQNLKTFDNSPDEEFTGKRTPEQNLRVSVVYVLNRRNKPLMPTSPQKARKLLKKGQAHVVNRTPFTIKLKASSGETKQEIVVGLDPGYSHIGISAITEIQELFSSEVLPRTDIVNLLSKRRSYRRTRRSRNLWHREPRFLNRGIKKGWLAPSVQHKLDTHIKVIENTSKILPVDKVIVEVANFDIQKIKNPDISGTDYQQGEQLGFWNAREYVLYRDNYKCRYCKGKSKDKILRVHHIVSRQIGGDRPDNLLTLCETCHDSYHRGEISLDKIKKTKFKGFKAETFMSIIRWRIVEELKKKFKNVEITYGYITKSKRIELGIFKTHNNDAFVIAGGTLKHKRSQSYLIKQVRKQNRKLYKGIRSHIRNTADRFIKGFQRYDKVKYKGIECFIFGRRTRGTFDIRKLNGEKINGDVKYTKLKLLEKFKTMLFSLGGRNSSHG